MDESRRIARHQFWKNLVAQFLRRNPALVYTQPSEEEYAFASPRTWDFAISLAATCDLLGMAPLGGSSSGATEAFVRLINGSVGSGAAQSLLGFIRNMRIPDPEEVLLGKVKVPMNLRSDELNVLFGTMAILLAEWVKSSSQNFGVGLQNFLEEALSVAKEKKPDAIYTAIRRVTKEGILSRGVRLKPELRKLMEMLSKHYEGLVEVLEGDE